MALADVKNIERYQSVESFCLATADLLREEREAEIDQSRCSVEGLSFKQLQKQGVCLTKLNISSRKTGLYGRQVLTFAPNNVNRPELPATNITPGDILGLHTSEQESSLSSGVVLKVITTSLTVAFEQSEELSTLGDDETCHLIKLANDITHKRLKRAMDRLQKYRTGPASTLIDVLFNQSTNPIPRDIPVIKLFNENLDGSQQAAVQLALAQQHLAIIHGPPGTGKTTTVVEVIRQLVAQGLKVLACAPSNVAVDNLVLRLANSKMRVVRLGHPARVMADIQKYSLDAQINSSDENSIVNDVKKDIDDILKKMRRGKKGGERQSVRIELKTLRKELRERSDTAVSQVLSKAEVVLSTLTSATDDGPLRILEDMHFDVVIIDECSQSTEAACWIPLLQAPKCILAGDHHQLPPTIISHKAANNGLAVTLMERLINTHSECVQMLTVQYRMHEDIMRWASDELYESRLTAHRSVAKHLLADLPGVELCEETETALMLIDTAGCDLNELDLPKEQSKGNEGEADLVAIHTERLIDAGLKPQDIAVISPYNMQVELIRGRLMDKYPQLEVKSVDGYQGREKEAVIISLVRSNKKGIVGFLSEDRRLNVAITRARRHVAVICDSDTVNQHAFLARLINHLNKYGSVRSAAEFQQDQVIGGASVRTSELMQEINLHRVKSSTNKKSQNTGPVSSGGHFDRSDVKYKTTEEREERIHQEISGIISTFMSKENCIEYRFPSTLNSYERMIVHQIAERLDLMHLSSGQGRERCIKLVKPPPTDSSPEPIIEEYDMSTNVMVDEPTPINEPTPMEPQVCPKSSKKKKRKNKKCPTNKDATVLSTEPQLTDEIPDEAESELCPLCSESIPKSNIELHRMRCDKIHMISTEPVTLSNVSSCQAATERLSIQKSRKSKKKKTQGAVEALDGTDPDDLDALLAAVDKLDSVCNYTKCKILVRTLGTTCPFCTLRFCITHGLAEVHGCGDAAKQRARQSIVREGKLYNGSGIPNKKPSADRRAQLERRLNKKMGDFTDERKPKTHDKQSK